MGGLKIIRQGTNRLPERPFTNIVIDSEEVVIRIMIGKKRRRIGWSVIVGASAHGVRLDAMLMVLGFYELLFLPLLEGLSGTREYL